MKLPSEAIIAVTLNCNSRCLMCDIWKKRSKNEVKPSFYKKLPSSLKEINLSGGEPFLRKDLVEIIRTIKKACPQARLVISTNGFLTKVIKEVMPLIIKIDSRVAVRVSLDGQEKVHDQIRGVKGGYRKALESLNFLKGQVKDLGVGFTLMRQNQNQLLKVFAFCQKHKLDFSLSSVASSAIFFGKDKNKLSFFNEKKLKPIFNSLIKDQYGSLKPKDWLRAWFNQGLLDFLLTNKRKLKCGAGTDFFYLDAYGRVYACHLKPWLMGDLNKNSFEQIYASAQAKKRRRMAQQCQDCWLVCSVRPAIRKEWVKVSAQAFLRKASFWFQKVSFGFKDE